MYKNYPTLLLLNLRFHDFIKIKSIILNLYLKYVNEPKLRIK